ncbi:hypothetical protein P280DRAFT_167227 [Massarina eburnea CBS 473.64]|uniref:Uncharacterized protein n=1 Tax=Massarina eburnea CBS 473.64 TaxID=1395130 RepID=A0A6A6RNZ9_9PLEO|nr:hypothetical protein P280DRAFT_167227 [Massarina eburnea CBS 473.64]
MYRRSRFKYNRRLLCAHRHHLAILYDSHAAILRVFGFYRSTNRVPFSKGSLGWTCCLTVRIALFIVVGNRVK